MISACCRRRTKSKHSNEKTSKHYTALRQFHCSLALTKTTYQCQWRILGFYYK